MDARLKELGKQALRLGLEHLPLPLAADALTRVLPRRFTIEPTNLCNHACPLCPHSFHPRARGRMTLDPFRRLADEIRPFASQICLNMLGESLLNPDLFDMIRYAEDLGIPCDLTTNGQLLDRHIEQVFESRLTSIKVTLDGADKATHERYRVGADFDRVRAALEALCRARQLRGSVRPSIKLLSLLFGFNQGQQDEIRRWGQSVGVDRVVFRPVWIGIHAFDGSSREELARKWLPSDPLQQHESYLGTNLCRDQRICPRLPEAHILWNGDVVPCTRSAFDGSGAFGNVFADGGFVAVWRSERHRATILRVARHEEPLCQTCDAPTECRTCER